MMNWNVQAFRDLHQGGEEALHRGQVAARRPRSMRPFFHGNHDRLQTEPAMVRRLGFRGFKDSTTCILSP